MKYKINKLAVLALATLAVVSSCWATPNWSHDLNGARSIAAGSNKLIYVSIDASWCGWCQKMESETFTDQTVTEILDDSFVPVMLDGDTNQEFTTRYGVTGYPTGLVLDANGNVVRRIVGYHDAASLTDILRDVLAHH